MFEREEFKSKKNEFKSKFNKTNVDEAYIDNLALIAAALSEITKIPVSNIEEMLIMVITEKANNSVRISDFINSPYKFSEVTELTANLMIKYGDFLKKYVEENHFDFFNNPQDKSKFTSAFNNVIVPIGYLQMNAGNNKDYLSDFLFINEVLCDTEYCKSLMKDLEKDIVEYAKKMGAKLVPYRNDMFQLPPATEEKPYDKQKLLSGFFHEWTLKHGFNSKQFVKIMGQLEPDDFLRLLREKVWMKDEGAPIQHSPYAHVEEFYLIEKANEKQHRLKHPINEIYAYLGSDDCIGRKNQSLWNFLLDQTMEVGKFTSPEQITGYLMGESKGIKKEETDIPVLSALTARQREKQEIDNKYNINTKTRKIIDSPILSISYEKLKELDSLKKLIRAEISSFKQKWQGMTEDKEMAKEIVAVISEVERETIIPELKGAKDVDAVCEVVKKWMESADPLIPEDENTENALKLRIAEVVMKANPDFDFQSDTSLKKKK